MKLWDKGENQDSRIGEFTVGNDHILDLRLVKYDCIASKAHAAMLASLGIVLSDELNALEQALDEISALAEKGEFHISVDDEDCHTAIESYLTDRCGEAGRRIHAGRSRNDQVLTALRLYEKNEIVEITQALDLYIEAFSAVVKDFGGIGFPGYTHMQKAMPTTVGTWAGCYVDSAVDNRELLLGILKTIDQSPLGTAAGFGVPVLTLDRDMTANALGFARVMKNPIYAAMSRGKFESIILGGLTQIMLDLNKLAGDLILFNMSELGFVNLPEKICTGSSIMPHKKNPDALELVRAKYHVVLGEEIKIKSLIANLISGYNRDVQLTKEPLFISIDATRSCLNIMSVVLKSLEFDENACNTALSNELFAVEKAYELVERGVPFRDAYRIVRASLDSI
jgi:argininosuccinate lyase